MGCEAATAEGRPYIKWRKVLWNLWRGCAVLHLAIAAGMRKPGYWRMAHLYWSFARAGAPLVCPILHSDFG